MTRVLLGGWVVLTALCAGCESGHCDAADLRRALASASAGDVVEVGACRVEGEFVVNAGVTLRGLGSRSTLASGAVGATVVELLGGELALERAPSRLENLTVESRGFVGVVLRGPGSAEVSDVHVDALRGIGVGIDRADARLTNVVVLGEVRADTMLDPRWLDVLGYAPDSAGCSMPSCECEPGAIDDEGRRICSPDGRFVTWTSVLGIYARDAQLHLTNTNIEGIAEHGLVVDDSDVVMVGGGVQRVVGIGILSRGSDLDLDGVRVQDISRGLRGAPSYGLLLSDGAISSNALEVVDNGDFGLVQLGGSAEHAALVVRGNGNVGLWIGAAESVTIRSASRIVDNGFAGVVFNDSSAIEMQGVAVEDTHTMVANTTLFGAQEIGDGIVLSGSSDVSLQSVTLRGNERVGLTVDLGGTVTDVRFADVTVDASDGAFGALSGIRNGGTGVLSVGSSAGWDDGIVRMGAAAANDALAPAELDLIVSDGPESAGSARGIVAPMY